MNELYAIDPKALVRADQVRDIFSHLGFHSGQFLVRYPNDWMEDVVKRLHALDGLNRTRLEIVLRKYGHSVLPLVARYRRDLQWEENVESIRRNLAAAIGTDSNDHGLLTLEEFFWNFVTERLGQSAGDDIPRNSSAYLKAIQPLIQVSTELHITDRYFRFRTYRNNPTGAVEDTAKVQFISDLINAAVVHKRVSTIIIHVCDDEKYGTGARQQFEFEEDVDKLNRRHQSSNIELIPDFRERLPHGRYVFGLNGGLQFDHGLVFHRNPKETNHVHWLSARELANLHQKFSI